MRWKHEDFFWTVLIGLSPFVLIAAGYYIAEVMHK